MAMKGRDKHRRRLKSLADDLDGIVGAVLFEGADMIKAEAQHSITRGSVSGKSHVASNPGEPPNNNTGTLKNHIVAKRSGRVEAEVRSEAPYAAALEFGTSKMAARPYIRPARDKMMPAVRERMASQLDKLVKRSG